MIKAKRVNNGIQCLINSLLIFLFENGIEISYQLKRNTKNKTIEININIISK